MEVMTVQDLMFDIPPPGFKIPLTENTYVIEDIVFTMSDYGNLQPLIIAYNGSTDPDPTAFIPLPNLDVMIKKRLLIGDMVNERLEILDRPVDASPAIIPQECPRCSYPLIVSHARKLTVRCKYCATTQGFD